MEFNFCDSASEKCTHKPFFPFNIQEVFGLGSIVIGSALSNAGGIGGGGLLIPILLLILKFYTHEAIPISKLMIFTGALTSFLLGFKQSHPYRKAVTIDYNIPYLIVPCLLFGTMVGVSLNKVLPPWIILVSLTLVLVVNTIKTLQKARKLHKNENELLRLNVDNLAASGCNANAAFSLENNVNNYEKPLDEKLVIGDKDYINNNYDSNYALGLGQSDKQILILQEERKDLRKFPLDKISLMLFSYVFMLLISLLKGSDHFNSIIEVKRYFTLYIAFKSLYLSDNFHLFLS